MFAAHLRRVYYTCDKVIVRGIRSRRLGPKTGPNPGLDKRILAFRRDGFNIKAEEAEEIMEKSDSEFFNVGDSYKEHMNEKRMSKDELRHHLVKDKYFKDSLPNLLTWSEKEQIRHLATTNPDEWTPERIAESFPVTIPVVKKLLKYPWKPATEERIARHDASAMRNWRELKEGTLDIPEDLIRHFLKFSNRTIPPLRKESIKIDVSQQEKLGEFERIIHSCAANEESSKQTTSETNVVAIESNTSNTKQKKHGNNGPKIVTLDELASKIKKRLEGGNKVGINDKIMIDTMQTKKNEILEPNVTHEIELVSGTSEPNSLVEHKESNKDPMEVMNYPERIRIPKQAYKKGATYKVNDCYYDHDGKFLYRVLGMTN